MRTYRISNEAKLDLIRIHQFGKIYFGDQQAHRYIKKLYDCFDKITKRPYSFQAVNYIRKNYRWSVCGSESIYFTLTDKHVNIIAIIKNQDISSLL